MREPARVAGVEIESVTNELPITRYMKPDGGMNVVPDELDADVLVFQRVCDPLVLQALPVYQRRGQAVVVDVDDDLTALHPNHPARRFDYDWTMVRKACQMADMVTVTTPALAARYAPHGRYAIITNCVPEYTLDIPREPDRHTVGWMGVGGTHPGDLEGTYGGVADALEQTDSRFIHYGPPEDVRRRLRIPEERYECTDPITPYEKFFPELAKLGVGIVPLWNTKFNEAKSFLKGIEYAAVGVPFVASPVAEYERLHASGVGVLAGWKSRKWKRAVSQLVTDDALHDELSEHGRQVVRENHTFEKQGWRWAEAWQEALSNRHACSRTAVAA